MYSSIMKNLYWMIFGLSVVSLGASPAAASAQFQVWRDRPNLLQKDLQLKQALPLLSPVMISVNPIRSNSNSIAVTEFAQKSIVGYLGHPLGEIITISGVVRQAGSGSKSLRGVLSVEAVNGIPLAQPVVIEFGLFVTAQVSKPLLARSFKYVGYETGGFTGIPSEVFKYVAAVPSAQHQFNTSFQILREELDVVKTKADLIRFSDRRVEVVGRYVSHSTPAPAITNSIDFKGAYTTANIVLEDGTEIPIYPTYLKQSLRSPEEVKTFEGKIVKAIGHIQPQKEPSSNRQIAFVSFDGIWSYQSNF
jgi:hypothetical protein